VLSGQGTGMYWAQTAAIAVYFIALMALYRRQCSKES